MFYLKNITNGTTVFYGIGLLIPDNNIKILHL